MVHGAGGDVRADQGEVTGIEFKDVGATTTGGSLPAARVRVGSKTAFDHAGYVTLGKYAVKSSFIYRSCVLTDKQYHAVCSEVIHQLQKAREGRRLSKYAVAQNAGVSQQMVGYVERGLKKPSLETVLRMAEALDVDLGKLITNATSAARGDR